MEDPLERLTTYTVIELSLLLSLKIQWASVILVLFG